MWKIRKKETRFIWMRTISQNCKSRCSLSTFNSHFRKSGIVIYSLTDTTISRDRSDGRYRGGELTKKMSDDDELTVRNSWCSALFLRLAYLGLQWDLTNYRLLRLVARINRLNIFVLTSSLINLSLVTLLKL